MNVHILLNKNFLMRGCFISNITAAYTWNKNEFNRNVNVFYKALLGTQILFELFVTPNMYT